VVRTPVFSNFKGITVREPSLGLRWPSTCSLACEDEGFQQPLIVRDVDLPIEIRSTSDPGYGLRS
jgi:hypothetical protein